MERIITLRRTCYCENSWAFIFQECLIHYMMSDTNQNFKKGQLKYPYMPDKTWVHKSSSTKKVVYHSFQNKELNYVQCMRHIP